MKWTSIGLVLVLIAQVGLTYIALDAASTMRKEWPEKVSLKKEIVINGLVDRIWGPVNMVIPTDCSDVRAREQEFGSKIKFTDSHVLEGPHERHFESGRFTFARGAAFNNAQRQLRERTFKDMKEDGEKMASELASKSKKKLTDLAHKAYDKVLKQPVKLVQICNYTREFKTPRFWKRYMSMMTLSGANIYSSMDGAGLVEERETMFTRFRIGLLVCMVAKYALKLVDVVLDCCGTRRYHELWNNERSRCDRALESLMVHGFSMVFCLAQQILLCSMFLSFWHHDHFVMVFVPMLGYRYFFISLAVVTVYMVTDRLAGFMVRWSDWYLLLFWLVYVAWVIVIAVPMVSSCVFIINYVWMVAADGWLNHGMTNFSDEFRHAARNAVGSCACFCIVAVLDVVIIIASDLERRSHAVKVLDANPQQASSRSRQKRHLTLEQDAP